MKKLHKIQKHPGELRFVMRDMMSEKNLESRLRNAVVGVEASVPLLDGRYSPGVNFDNAATTPPLCAVMQRVSEFSAWYSSVHRGTGYKSMLSSNLYEEGRVYVQEFVGADPQRDVLIYTKNTTEAIGAVANLYRQTHADAVVLSTEMEHLANDLPWRYGLRPVFVRVDEDGRLDLNDLEENLRRWQGKVKLVTVTGASNVTGYVNPVHRIAELAHLHGAEILVDGAQLVPHASFDMRPHSSIEHIDYLVFSAHKMYAPFGVGALIGPKRAFTRETPHLQGGGAVRLVGREFVQWDDPPYREEAGTPNVIGVAALLAAIEALRSLRMDVIHRREQQLLDYITRGLAQVPQLRLFGMGAPTEEKVSIVSFALPGLEHRLVAKILSYEFGVAVRSGLFCAHPYVQRLLGMTQEDVRYYQTHPEAAFPGLVRVSLGLYNTRQEADVLLCGVRQIAAHPEAYARKYREENAADAYERQPFFYPFKRQLP